LQSFTGLWKRHIILSEAEYIRLMVREGRHLGAKRCSAPNCMPPWQLLQSCRSENGQEYMIFVDTQAAMERCLADHQGPGQETAWAIIRWNEHCGTGKQAAAAVGSPATWRLSGQGGSSGRTLCQRQISAVLVMDKYGLPHQAGNRSQNERYERVDRGDKEVPILHSAEKNQGSARN